MQTSIHIEPVKLGSEAHNKREKPLDYVRPDLTAKNESWEIDSVANRLATVQENYLKTVGQKMQAKATPIREGVVVIAKDTTMEQLRDFAEKAEKRFGIKAFQIHMHQDEGHQKSKEWKPNLHAHILFDWTDEKGKSCKLNKQDMSEMQTILSESIRMERGKNSDKKHLTAIQYKNHKEEQTAQELSEKIKKLQTSVKVKSVVSKTADKISQIIGGNPLEKEVKALESEKKALEDKINKLTENFNYVSYLKKTFEEKSSNFREELRQEQAKNRELEKKVRKTNIKGLEM